jgi:hypothetical protein
MSQEIKNTVYCTIFDDNYLARALALYESLMRVNETATFAFFCIDAKSAGLLTGLKLERSIVVTHDEFATAELLEIRDSRSQGEYCWTCKPFALLYLMHSVPQTDWVVYVDTDMMFFADPDEAISGANVHYLLTPHRFEAAFSASEKSAGKHNAGYVAARNSSQGERVIAWWRDRCVESCSYIPTDTTFADQKYLDRFAELFPYGDSSTHKGLNTAPWNVNNFTICNGAKGVYVDEVPLLLYHFQGLQLFENGTASLYIGDKRISDKLRDLVYQPHLFALLRAFARLRAIDPGFSKGLGKPRKYLGSIAKRVMKVITNRANVVPFDVV